LCRNGVQRGLFALAARTSRPLYQVDNEDYVNLSVEGRRKRGVKQIGAERNPERTALTEPRYDSLPKTVCRLGLLNCKVIR
jgi:hypothetical protein